MSKLKKLVAVAVAACMGSGIVMMAACTDSEDTSADTYTYTVGVTALATNWNPHTWETSSDSTVMSFIESPLVDISILDSEEGTYQWVYEMATSVTDVTASHQDDLVTYNGYTAEEAASVTEGYVYEITLNEDATWENGVAINADTYIYSMQQLISPDMMNYRANLYIAGESALAGAYNYYYSKTDSVFTSLISLGYESMEDVVADIEAGEIEVVIDMWNFWGLEGCVDAEGNECPQYVSVTDETLYRDTYYEDETEEGAWISAVDIFEYYYDYWLMSDYSTYYGDYIGVIVENENYGATWDTVGLYKVDDYTIRYVCATYLNWDYFMTSLTSNWIVYEDLYESLKETTGTLTTTSYGTSVATTMAYGPYKISSIDTGRQMQLVQNEEWYGYETTTDDNGNEVLVSYTNFLVDGESVQQYQTTNIVFNVMTEDTMEQAFFRGELSEWSPSSDQVSTYNMSQYLYQVDETYTMSLFFNTDVDVLKALDSGSSTNQNSVVLSNYNFRKAFSLAIDRSEFVQSTAGYKAAYSLMNSLYYYDIYNDPTSVYRDTDEAMEAICKLYGVEYGEGTAYATLEDAYNSITGYNLTEAQALMAQAYAELVEEGLYSGGDIVIEIAWAAGSLTSDDYAQIALLQQYLNAAVAGTGFGTITLTPIGNLTDRYSAVPNGTYAIGYGAWGGAAFYPFRNFQVYMDPDQYSINEAGCWDPTTYTFTLEVPLWDEDGELTGETETVTMTAQEWSNSMTGNGVYATAPFEVQLSITAQLEYEFLNLYYRIPLASTTSCFLLSQQISYYTDNYNIMYDFGGFRLMSYNYTDAEWTAYVASCGGTLSYV